LTHPDHVTQDAEQIRRLLAGEIPVYHTDKRYTRKDGQMVWGRLKVSAMRGADGRFEHFLAMLEDITAVKEAERAIADEKERLLVTLRSIGDGVITTDRQGRITLVNKVAEELTGWSLDDALGKPLAEVFHIINEQTRERCESPVEKVLKSGGIVGLANHTALIRRDGTEMIIADSGAPIRDRESRIIGVVLVFRDITEKEKGALILQNAQKLEAVGVLAAGIAHDFNNLLGGIFGYLELAREQAEQGDGGGAAKTLYKGIGVFDRAKNLTQQLLTFSKGGLPLRKTLSLADHVRKSVSFALSGSNISPVFTISPDVRLCDFDENQMAQVFDNIAINARQAMPLGGKIDVTVRNVAPDDAPAPLAKNTYVCVSIRDYGVGITKEHLPRIFDPFFTTKQQGNGLGLATSYSIVKNHDGIIDVESAPGKGATFHIYLPASPGQIVVSEKAIKHVHKGEGRILVMDDEEFVLDVATHLLQSMGYAVTAARDGDEAIALTRQAEESGERFSAAILDLTIPGGKGGREIVSELLKIDPKLKVIASSGYSSDPVMSTPADYGFSTRLAKPYRKDDLARVLEAVLGVSP
jgi:PAS domain S-box-containing protein